MQRLTRPVHPATYAPVQPNYHTDQFPDESDDDYAGFLAWVEDGAPFAKWVALVHNAERRSALRKAYRMHYWRERKRRAWRLMQSELVHIATKQHVEYLKGGPHPLYTSRELSNAQAMAAKLEQLDTGEATERVEVGRTQHDWSKLSTEQLLQARQLALAARGELEDEEVAEELDSDIVPQID